MVSDLLQSWSVILIVRQHSNDQVLELIREGVGLMLYHTLDVDMCLVNF